MIYLKGTNKKDIKMIIRLMKKLRIITINVEKTIIIGSNDWTKFNIDYNRIG